jgi:xanthine dehydrogenase YagT iron-sulfur-binding subunit
MSDAPVPVVRLTINGVERELDLDPRLTLLDALRDHCRLTGAKRGCDRGECGACTVLVEGEPILACLRPAVRCEGASILTIEGLGTEAELHPVQRAFADHEALQCGFCTPGQILSAVALLRSNRTPSDEAIRSWMSGNLCRCAAYPQILAAVKAAAGALG